MSSTARIAPGVVSVISMAEMPASTSTSVADKEYSGDRARRTATTPDAATASGAGA
jgi:hypothetical protein